MTAAALPHLRQDLRLLDGGAGEDGAPTWLIYDPLRNRYFRIGLAAFRLLRHWRGGEPAEALLTRAEAAGLDLAAEEVAGFVRFLAGSGLTAGDGAATARRLEGEAARARRHWLAWLVHNYLFIRIPLARPDAFLARSLPWVRPLLDRRVHNAILLLGAVGLLLAGRQWDEFLATFAHFFSWDGLALYGLTLFAVKAAHELGHGYAAKRRGCRVASMGIAFLVLFPVLYTDTTDVWRLRRRRERLAVALAGVAVELHLALIATFLWSFLPDGPARSAAFLVATTTWVTSLAINLSPFMRFDGYYALSDWLGADNLQPRAFALARWRLRELLFGFGEAPLEPLPDARRRLFIVYAWATWAYRLVLFLGIALLVYHLAFKALGIVLFAVEIVWFILLPIGREIGQWWARRRRLAANRRGVTTLLLLLAGLGLAAVPWRPTLSLPAVLEAEDIARLYPPEAAQVAELRAVEGEAVAAGAALLTLALPALEHEARQARRRLALMELRIERRGGSPEDLHQLVVLEQERVRQETVLAGIAERRARLTVTAPLAGRLDRLADLRPGQWVAPGEPLAVVVAPEPVRVFAFLPEEDIGRIRPGAPARFLPDDGQSPPVALTVAAVDETALAALPYPSLAARHGGPIAARPLSDGSLRPERALYRVTLTPTDETRTPAWHLPGTALIEGPPRSWLADLARTAAAVLVRESGF